MLTRIRNAVTAKHTRVDMPASRLKAEIARILQDEGYIQGFKVLDEPTTKTTPAIKTLRLFLKYGPHGEKLITGVAAHQPARPPRLLRPRRRARRAGGTRHEHSDDVARRHDRPRSRQGRRRRRSALQHLVASADQLSASARRRPRADKPTGMNMSRIGKKPITIPKGVTVKVVDGAVEVQGPKGKLHAGASRPASTSSSPTVT